MSIGLSINARLPGAPAAPVAPAAPPVAPVAPVAPPAPTAPLVIPAAPRSAAEEQQWRQMSSEWKNALQTLVKTIDTVNQKGTEVDKQKELLRAALTQGRFDVIERERALALYKEWNNGIQMIPLYPQDYLAALRREQERFRQTADRGAVKLRPIPFASSSRNTFPGPGSRQLRPGYWYQEVAARPAYQWMQVAPPDVFSAGPQWRVRPLADNEPILDQAVAMPTAAPVLYPALRPPWVVEAQRRAIANQYQRVYHPQDIWPTVEAAPAPEYY